MLYKQFVNKYVKIVTKTNFTYVGTIQEVDTHTLVLTDKYNKLVGINLNHIKLIEETGEGQ